MPPLSIFSISPCSSPLEWGLLTYQHAALFSGRRGPYHFLYCSASRPFQVKMDILCFLHRRGALVWRSSYHRGETPILSIPSARTWMAPSTFHVEDFLLSSPSSWPVKRGPQELLFSLVSPQKGLNNPEEGGRLYSLMHTSAAHFVWSLGCQDYPELTGTRMTYMWLVSLSQPQAGAAGGRQDLWPTIHSDCLVKTKFYK